MALLQQGARGDDVRRVQEALNAAGYTIPVDGIYGPRTAAAVQAWKRSKGYEDVNGSLIDTVEILGTLAPGGSAGIAGSSSDPIADYIRANYGFAGWAIDHPELGPILRNAAENQWDQAKLQGAISATEWWKTSALTMRQWEALRGQDPAEAGRLIDRKLAGIQDMAGSLGVSMSVDRQRQLAEDAIRFGWTDADIRNVIGSEFRYVAGGTQSLPAQLKDAASAYAVRMTDADLESWGQRIITGDETLQSFNVHLRNQSAALFPMWADAINRGAEVKTLAGNYLSLAAQELERTPDEIWMNDRYMASVFQGAGEGKLPSISEFTRSIRGLPEWRETKGARELAAAWSGRLLDWFGKVEMPG